MNKVLLATVDFPPQQGGVARYLWALKQTLGDRVEVLYWPKPLGRSQMLRELWRAAKQCETIWVSHILPIGTMAWLIKLVGRKPYVVILHGMDFDLARRNWWKRFLARRILKNAQRVVANSHALAAEIQAFVRIREPLVVHPCIPDFLVQGSRRPAVVGNEDIVTLLTVSRLVERKGHLDVLRAVRDLPHVRYLIVGDGPYYRKIYYRIKDLELQDRVRIIKNVSDDELARMYQQADIFVMPTQKREFDREGFGIVYLEAQLFGLPVVAANHAGIDEAVLDKVTGFLINDQQVELKRVIEKLAGDRELRQRMGQFGRDFVLAGFTREKQFAKLHQLL